MITTYQLPIGGEGGERRFRSPVLSVSLATICCWLWSWLSVAAATQPLSVRVIDVSGTPVGQLHVTVDSAFTLQTDDQGACQFDLQPGVHTVTLSAADLTSRKYAPSPSESVRINDRPETARFVLEPIVSNVQVSGHFTDDQGNDLDTGSVDILFFPKGSNESVMGTWKGAQFTADLYRGYWTIQMLVRNAGSGLLPPTAYIQVCDNVTVTNLDLIARRLDRFIQGTVVDARGNPVPGAFVQGIGVVGNSSYRSSVLSNVKGEFALTACDGTWFVKPLGFTRYTQVPVSGQDVSNVLVTVLGSPTAGVVGPPVLNTNAWIQGSFLDEAGLAVTNLQATLQAPGSYYLGNVAVGEAGDFEVGASSGVWTLRASTSTPDGSALVHTQLLPVQEGTNQFKILIPQIFHKLTVRPTNPAGPLPANFSFTATIGDGQSESTTYSTPQSDGSVTIELFDGNWTLNFAATDEVRAWVVPAPQAITVAGKDLELEVPVCIADLPWQADLQTVDEAGKFRPDQGSSWRTDPTGTLSPNVASIPFRTSGPTGSDSGSSTHLRLQAGLRLLGKLPPLSIPTPAAPNSTPEPAPTLYCGPEYGPVRLQPHVAAYLPRPGQETNLVLVEKTAAVLVTGNITNLTAQTSVALSLTALTEMGTTNYQSGAMIFPDGRYLIRLFPGDWIFKLTESHVNPVVPGLLSSSTITRTVTVPAEGTTEDFTIPPSNDAPLYPANFAVENAPGNPPATVSMTVVDSLGAIHGSSAKIIDRSSLSLNLPAGKAQFVVNVSQLPSSITLIRRLSVEPTDAGSSIVLPLPERPVRVTGLLADGKGNTLCEPIQIVAVSSNGDLDYRVTTTADPLGRFELALFPGDWVIQGDELSLETRGYRVLGRVGLRLDSEAFKDPIQIQLTADPMPADYLESVFQLRQAPDGSTVFDLWHSFLGSTVVESSPDLQNWTPLSPSDWQGDTIQLRPVEDARFYRVRRSLDPPLF